MAALDDGAGDPGDLVGCLSLTEHDFRKPLAAGPAVVHAREGQVLDRAFAQERVALPRRLVGVEPAGAHGVEERAQRLNGKRAMYLIRHGL
jgi:hypothetical protein